MDEKRTISHRTVAIGVESFDLAGKMAETSGVTRRAVIEKAIQWYARDQAGVSPYRWEQRRVNLLPEKPDDLSDREWRVILLRLAGRATLGDVGKHLGITRERVRQIERKALTIHPEYVLPDREG